MKRMFAYMVFVAALSCAPQILSQQGGKPEPQKSKVNDLRTLSGALVAEGRTKTTVGPLKLVTYKLEEVTLPQPVEVEVRGEKKQFQNVLRLTIMSESNIDAHLIWIDDASLPGVWGVGGKGVAALIYDRSILRNGAVISLSHGGQVYELPEQLTLPEKMQATIAPETIGDGNTYTLRSALRIIGSVRQPLVEIDFRTNRGFPILNAAYGVQIGKRFFPANASDRTVRLSLTTKEFAELSDGERIAVSTGWVNYSALGTGAWYFGRLDKSRLDR